MLLTTTIDHVYYRGSKAHSNKLQPVTGSHNRPENVVDLTVAHGAALGPRPDLDGALVAAANMCDPAMHEHPRLGLREAHDAQTVTVQFLFQAIYNRFLGQLHFVRFHTDLRITNSFGDRFDFRLFT